MDRRYAGLVQEKADLVAEGEGLVTAAEQAGRDLNDQEGERYGAIAARLQKLSVDIAVEEQMRQHRRDVAVVPQQPPTGQALVTTIHDRAADKPWGTDTGAPFGEFLQAVAATRLQGTYDPRLYQASLGAQEAVGSDGGFLVRTDIAAGILKRMFDTGQILSRVTRVPISSDSNGVVINALQDASRANGSRWGGIQGYWVEEGGPLTASRPKFRRVNLQVRKVAALGYATDELLADASALEAIMTNGFEDELTFMTEDAVWEGTGVGQPMGILGSAATLSIAKETGQPAASIVFENIEKMWARMWAPARSRAAWFINQDIEPQLDSMAMSIGTGGVPVYLPAGGLSGSPFSTLKGRPVIPVEYASTLGTVGDIVLADFSQYLFIDKSIQQASSIHVAFLTDEMAFRATYRVDGQPAWATVLTPFKGTSTLSPFVTLATRA